MYCIIDTIWSQILGKLGVAKKPQKSPAKLAGLL
jgi:hypothetical protein